MRYIQGQNRTQSTLFPEVMDDFIAEDNAVRLIDAWVDSLDLSELGFAYAEPKQTGRKPYNPSDLLKLYVYGYLKRIRSSRRLEVETHRNVELMWLIQMLRPDFKTIADFRKDNSKAIRKLFHEFNLFCRKLGLFGLDLIAIDGSKFSAVNHSSKAYSQNKLKKEIERRDEQIDNYLRRLDEYDHEENDIQNPSADQIKAVLVELKSRREILISFQQDLEKSGTTQIALTDPDSRMMKSDHGGRDMCYNIQLAVDRKHKLIASYEVTNDVMDQHQLAAMSKKVKDEFQLPELSVVADAGYFSKLEIKKCVDADVKCYIPEPVNPPQKKRRNLYLEDRFEYEPSHNFYTCPARQHLLPTYKCCKNNKQGTKYGTRACSECPVKEKCTTSKYGRFIYRWEHESIIEQMRKRIQENPQIMPERKKIVEHPFGTIKHAYGYRHFLCRGIKKTSTEMGLTALVYNLMRTINILGVKELINALA